MTDASEKISEELPVGGCISELNCLPVRTPLQRQLIETTQKHLRAYGAMHLELLQLRAEHDEMRKALLLARTVISVACGEKAPFARIALDLIDAAQGASRGTV